MATCTAAVVPVEPSTIRGEVMLEPVEGEDYFSGHFGSTLPGKITIDYARSYNCIDAYGWTSGSGRIGDPRYPGPG